MALSIDHFPGPEFCISGKNYLYFGGTAYLGIPDHEGFKKVLFKNISRYGSNYGASRLSNVQLSVYEEVETHIAKLTNAPDCISLSSGYLAGRLLHEYFHTHPYKVFCLQATHSALADQNSIRYTSVQQLKKDLSRFLNVNARQEAIIMLDTINPDGSAYPKYDFLRELPLERCILVADDSHGAGITGLSGWGCYEYLNSLRAKEVVVCASMGKGPGIPAGIILGSQNRLQELRQTALYQGASPALAAYLATFKTFEHDYYQQLLILRERIRYFKQNLTAGNILSSLEEYPVFTFCNTDLSAFLKTNGILLTDFRYVADGSSEDMSRMVLTASHTTSHIDHLLGVLNKFKYL